MGHLKTKASEISQLTRAQTCRVIFSAV